MDAKTLDRRNDLLRRIAVGLKAQGGAAVDETGAGACRYKTGEGKKCAVGLLIPDEKYTPEIEGYALAHMDERLPNFEKEKLAKLHAVLQSSGIYEEDYDFLRKFQAIHDTSYAPLGRTSGAEWWNGIRTRLVNGAIEWELDINMIPD
jgi:hypothetical protein